MAQSTSSKAMEKLNIRVVGLQTIDPNLVLQNGLSVKGGLALTTAIKSAQDAQIIMETALTEKKYEIARLIKDAEAFSKGIFDTVKSQFGDDSIEYEKVGGTRRSMHAKPGAKAAKVAKAKAAKIAKTV